MKLIKLKCDFCKKKFTRKSTDKSFHINKNYFCCLDCANKFQRTLPLIFICLHCGEKNENLQGQNKKFCNSSCAAKYNNTHKTKGIRISKLELWLQKQLPLLYPKLEFHFNRKDTINSELDIYIPSLNLAFELNGIFHYEPIFGTEKLASIQNNDSRKFQACLEHNIELVIIDTSTFTYFKEQIAKKFLDIIIHIIDNKRRVEDSNFRATS